MSQRPTDGTGTVEDTTATDTDGETEESSHDLIGQLSDFPRSRRSFLRQAATVGVGATALGMASTGTAAAAHADEPYSDSPYEDKNQFGYGALTDVEILRFALILERLEATFYTQAVGTAPVGEGGGDDEREYDDDYRDDRDDYDDDDRRDDDDYRDDRDDYDDDDRRDDDERGDGANGMGGRLSEREIETSDSALQFAAEPELRNSTFEYFQRIRNHEQAHVDAIQGIFRKSDKPGTNPNFASNLQFVFPYDNADEFIDLAQTFEDTGAGAYTAAAPAIDTEAYLAAAVQIALVEGRHASYLRVLTPASQIPFSAQPPGAFQERLGVTEVAKRVIPFIKGVDSVSEVVSLVQTGNDSS